MTELTFEQRKRQAEQIGNRVRGSTRAHLQVDAGAVCLVCGGPAPCFCERPTERVPDAPRSRGATLPLPDHTTAAKARLAALTGSPAPAAPVAPGAGGRVRMIRSASGAPLVARPDVPELARRMVRARAAAAQPIVVNVQSPDIHVPAPHVTVNPPTVNVAAPAVTINQPPRASKVVRDKQGRITGVEPVETRD